MRQYIPKKWPYDYTAANKEDSRINDPKNSFSLVVLKPKNFSGRHPGCFKALAMARLGEQMLPACK